jgi:hypothetical protein
MSLNDLSASNIFEHVLRYCLDKDHSEEAPLIPTADNDTTGAMQPAMLETAKHLPLLQHLYAFARMKSPRTSGFQIAKSNRADSLLIYFEKQLRDGKIYGSNTPDDRRRRTETSIPTPRVDNTRQSTNNDHQNPDSSNRNNTTPQQHNNTTTQQHNPKSVLIHPNPRLHPPCPTAWNPTLDSHSPASLAHQNIRHPDYKPDVLLHHTNRTQQTHNPVSHQPSRI